MSWGLTYVLPWSELDIPAIEAAIHHVLSKLPARPRDSEIKVRNPDFVTWYIYVYPDEERQWTLEGQDDLDRLFKMYDISEDEPICVDILFSHDVGDEEMELPPRTTFSFDTAWSGNSLASGGAIHICELLGGYFGVQCETN